MVAFVAVAADETFVSPNPTGNAHPIAPVQGEATEALFRGDMVAEIGLGCSNGSGTSGGPNDWAVGVTATLTPPFGIISTTYDIFTNVSPTITALTFKVWNAGATPGPTFAAQPGLPFTQMAHTVPIAPAIVMSAPSFYIGLGQPQTNVGIRLGMDTTTWEGSQFILAPGCGASTWTANDAIGFPGNWVVRAIIDDTIPVELMTFTAE
jgi:hypothetical protein